MYYRELKKINKMTIRKYPLFRIIIETNSADKCLIFLNRTNDLTPQSQGFDREID